MLGVSRSIWVNSASSLESGCRGFIWVAIIGLILNRKTLWPIWVGEAEAPGPCIEFQDPTLLMQRSIQHPA
jgi:hypothetical protein